MQNSKNVFQILIDDELELDIRNLKGDAKKRITSLIKKLQNSENPLAYGEPYNALMMGLFKFVVGDFRVIAKVERGTITIVRVLGAFHRGDSYNKRIIAKFKKRAEL